MKSCAISKDKRRGPQDNWEEKFEVTNGRDFCMKSGILSGQPQQKDTVMGEKGKKDKGGKETRKKAALSPKEKKQAKQAKKLK
ncbi:MAG: hypothetical protein JJU05_16375 [Verrucomicrobia bacterium]|nr:hypothetical protein [Verrucomicrobiota bacterium]